MSVSFNQRCVLVTGGTTGIGLGIARHFVSLGARVVVSSRRISSPGETDWGGFAIPCDVTSERSVEELFDRVLDEVGPVDVLVNNAGHASQAACVDMDLNEWRDVIDTNLTGTFLCSRAALRHMLPDRGGSIVNISSQGGKLGMALLTHYCASKAAVLGFSRALAMEVAPVVRVNSVCPGQILTPMIEAEIKRRLELQGETRAEVVEHWLSRTPMGTFQEVGDIAEAVAFLASDAAKNITGAAINVSGGMVMD